MSDFVVLNWLAIGVVVGLGSKLLFPGRGSGGWTGTLLISIAGAVADGWSGSHLYGQHKADSLPNWIASIVGAVLMLTIYRFVIRRNRML